MAVCRCVTGIVVEEGSTLGQPGLTVEIGTRAGRGFLPVNSGRTGPDGRFSIELGAFVATAQTGTTYGLRVLAGTAELHVHGDVRWSEGVDAHGLVVCVTYPQRCSAPPPPDLDGPAGEGTGLHGRVVHVDGTPLDGLTVKFRTVGVAGESDDISVGTTSGGGFYSITGPGSPAPDIIVRVYTSGARLVGTSPVIYGCPTNRRVDFEICDDLLRGPSEFSRVDSMLGPLPGSVAVADLTTGGLAWMSGRSGIPLDKVVNWAVAIKLSTTMSVGAEPLYGLLHEGFPRSSDGILARSPSAVSRALRSAKRKNIIANTVNITIFLSVLGAARAAALNDASNDSLGAILRTSQSLLQSTALTTNQITTFCASYATWEGTDAAFWAQVPNLSWFTQAAAEEARRLVTLGSIGLCHAPCVTAMLRELGTAAAATVGGWDTDTWKKIAGDELSPWTYKVYPLPAGLEGNTDAEQRASLAILLRENAHQDYRTENARAALQGSLGGFPAEAASFFNRTGNAAIDLENARLSIENGELDSGTTEDELDAARMAQRLFRIAPALDASTAMGILATQGYTSARDVVVTGKARFVEDYVAGGGDADTAVEVYQKAASQTAMSAAVFLQAHPNLARLPVSFVPDDTDLLIGVDDALVPGWADLFGSGLGSACKHCQSIHGPAAYLVDLLHWLGTKFAPTTAPVGAPETALAALVGPLPPPAIGRRPDLAQLKLSCENTERVLPYIDLSLEILETVVTGGDLEDAAYDSEVATEEQLAAPQHTNLGAYDFGHLGGSAVAPRTPFHRALVEMRPYLDHLGLERTHLMRIFGSEADSPPSVQDIAAEELSLSQEAAAVIETYHTDINLEGAFWPLDLTAPLTVRSLRRAAELTWPDILDLLHSRTANSGGSPIHAVAEANPTDVNLWLIGTGTVPDLLVPEEFSRIRQLTRLWRATGWTLLELDKVLVALGLQDPASWNSSTPILAVGNIHRLCRLTECNPVEIASWFGLIDTWQDRSTREEPVLSWWDQTWLSPSLFSQSEVAESGFPFRLHVARIQVANPALPLLDYTDKLSAVLGIGTEELTALVALFGDQLDLNGSSVPVVTRNNLSILYRWASLARALHLSPTDTFTLAQLVGTNPFQYPQSAINLLETWQELSAAGWSVAELDYVLRHESRERVAPTDDFLRNALGQIRDALLNTMSASSGSTTLDTLLDDLGRRVSEAFGVDRSLVEELREQEWPNGASAMPDGASVRLPSAEAVVLVGTGPFPVTVPTGSSLKLTASAVFNKNGGGTVTVSDGTVFTLESDAASLQVPSGTQVRLSAGSEVKIDGTTPYTIASGDTLTLTTGNTATLSDSSPPSQAEVVLVDSSEGLIRGYFAGDVAVELVADIQATFGSAVVTGLPAALTGDDLLRRLLRTTFWEVEINTDDGDPYDDIDRTDENHHDGDYDVLQLLHKACLLIGRVGADSEERAAWSQCLTSLELLNPSSLALADITSILPAYARLKHTIDLFALRARLPGESPTFAALITSSVADSSDVRADNFKERTGWDWDTLNTLFDWMGTATVDGLATLLDRMDVIRRAGASAETVASWASAGNLLAISDAVSRSVVAAARSRYSTPGAWAAVARPLRDPVRKAQRDALVSYLIAQEASDEIEEADDLYERYLIDVSMNPEMLTSRIKQAACSVQLFVHRCLFGLESNGPDSSDPAYYDLGDWFNDEDRAEWEWMRTYRVWEAARKVLLYPENWIEPELREDKSPFFEELEKEIAQGDLNADRAEDTLLGYLDRLHEVSSLQVLASHVQRESDADGTIDLLHVFARTRSLPATYWYRRRENSATWTAWERIEAGIQGEHLLPVIYNRRLLLFWGEFTEVGSEEQNPSVPSWWEVRLAMSEYRDGRWSAKKLSADPVSLNSTLLIVPSLNLGAINRYGLLSSISEDNLLTIRLYGASSASVIALHDLANFEVDPCTMEITGSKTAPSPTDRHALEINYWRSPGFRTVDYDENLDRTDHLAVNLGEADADGEPLGDFAAVSVLGSCFDATVVVPAQWQDFVSQAPFFVNVGSRVYFVEPAVGTTTVEVDDVGDLDEEEGVSTAPAIQALASRRGGTSTSASIGSTLTDEQVTTYSLYLNGAHYSSAQDAMSAIVAADETWISVGASEAIVAPVGQYRFSNFYHPLVCRFTKEVRRKGVFGLLDPEPAGTAADLVRQAVQTDFDFEAEHSPTLRVSLPYPVEDVDFSEGGAYSQYNWEIFFHLPFYIGSRLADAGQFDDAVDWLHCVFDPRTRVDANAGSDALEKLRWWKLKPFMTASSAPVTDWMAFSGADGDTADRDVFERQVAAWRKDPFNPHMIARMRAGTYQKAFVMRYLDTLIGWGDQLFTRDTIETINEATQLYVFARKVLGDRPEQLGPAEAPTPQSYLELEPTLDGFGNAMVALENATFSAQGYGGSDAGSAGASNLGYSFYFCVPPNARLLSYWDTVEDRLFKIRNGMNIAGVARSLPLYEPPIDPARLVRAAAAGIDIGAAVDGLTLERPHHRFPVLLSRAQALAGNVKALGGALLSALEKRDAEQLALLRQNQEEALHAEVTALRQQQVDEATVSKAVLKKQKAMVEARKSYYERLIDVDRIAEEKTADKLTKATLVLDSIGAGVQTIGAILAWFPNVKFGPFDPGPETGGPQFANALSALASALGTTSGALKTSIGRLNTEASYKRRKQEWKFQKRSAEKELAQIEKQLEGADIRIEITKRELNNQKLQASHSAEVLEWMQRKYTNAELYDWMVSQLSTLHFQTYQLALATAKKAQASYRYELGPDEQSANFIQPVYWDSLRKGLLAGERLAADLDRMDVSYLDRDAREFELIKHISLARLDPVALEQLKADGECWFEVPKVWFDADCPGHYYRRIQSVALSIACVAGPVGSVNAQLTLHGYAIEETASTADPEQRSGDYSSIVTSAAVNDSGLFNPDPKDPRYLPFERRGAISRWHLRLTAREWKQLDWASITDVHLHMRYTARDGGAVARDLIADNVVTKLRQIGLGFPSNAWMGATATGAPVAFSAKRDAADAWFAAQDGPGAFELALDPANFPSIVDYTYSKVLVIPISSSSTPTLEVPSNPGSVWTAASSGELGSLHYTIFTGVVEGSPVSVSTSDTLSITGIGSLSDLIVILLPPEPES